MVSDPWYPIIKRMYLNVHVSDHVSDQCLQWICLFFCRFPILSMHENPWFCQEMIYKWWVFHMVMVKIGISKDRRLNMDQYLWSPRSLILTCPQYLCYLLEGKSSIPNSPTALGSQPRWRFGASSRGLRWTAARLSYHFWWSNLSVFALQNPR